MSTNEILVIALGVLVPAALLWGLFLWRSGGGGRRITLGIPQAMRPGAPDDVLEGRRLERIQAWGLLATLATAFFIPFYWLPEGSRQEAYVDRFAEESLHRGELIYQVAPPLPEEADPQAFKRAEEQIAFGMGCANCHGSEGTGGFVPGGFTEPNSGRIVKYQAPPLNNVFTRWDDEVVRFTIARGRPGTPMPAWGVEFGGPMTEQMIDDVMNYLKSLPENNEPPAEISSGCQDPSGDNQLSCGEEIFEARCAVCHGPQAQGKEEEGLLPKQFPDPEDPDPLTIEPGSKLDRKLGTYYQGLALWKGDVRHLEREQHLFTVRNGRRFAFMPPFAEAPVQGVPVPPYPLTDAQIEAVIAYERSL